MARQGRFASRAGTGGSSLSMLIYNIMRAQYARQVEAMISAYKNGVSYMGEGIPSADRVISFLNEYAQKGWLTDFERQNITDSIKEIKTIENQRRGAILAAAVTKDPTNIKAVQEYIAYLKDTIASAETSSEKSAAESELYDAQGKLISAFGSSLRNGLTTVENYDALVTNVISEYGKGTPQYQTLLTSAFETKYDVLKFAEYNKVLDAASKGNAQYLKALNAYSAWIKGLRSEAVSLGIATADSSGTIIAGSDGILQIERDLSDAEGKQKDLRTGLALQANQERVQKILGETSSFLAMVNSTIGSNYTDITQFLSNQMDVAQFYSSAPGNMRDNPSFISKEELIDKVFGGGNSLIDAAKAAGSNYAGLYEGLVGIKKNYGSRSIVDESAVMFYKWGQASATASGNVQKLGRYHDDLIAKYSKLIEENKDRISATELYVHQQTLNSLIAARDGRVEIPQSVSAWDLANPYAAGDSNVPSKFTYGFDQILTTMAEDANVAKDVANGAVQVLRQVNGKWEYGEAVFPETTAGGKERIIKTGTGYAYGIIEGVDVLYVPPANLNLTPEARKKQTQVLGTYYDLGDGNFQIRSAEGVWYAENYDPISGKTMTSNDFRKSYVQTTTQKSTTGESMSGQASQFVVGGKLTPYDQAPISDDLGFLSADIDLDMKRIDRMYDPKAAATIKGGLLNSITGTVTNPKAASDLMAKYQTQIDIQKTGTPLPTPSLPMIKSAPGGGGYTPPSTPLPKAMITGAPGGGGFPVIPKPPSAAGAGAQYFFRNTPIAGAVGAAVGGPGAANPNMLRR